MLLTYPESPQSCTEKIGVDELIGASLVNKIDSDCRFPIAEKAKFVGVERKGVQIRRPDAIFLGFWCKAVRLSKIL